MQVNQCKPTNANQLMESRHILRPVGRPRANPAIAGFQAQRGSATIMALIVVGVASVLLTGMIWRQEIEIRTIENARDRTQVIWLQRSAIDFARLILIEDQRNSQYDHLGEIWAIPLIDSRVATFLRNEDHAGEMQNVTIMGSILDAQSYFNITNLWYPNLHSIDDDAVKAYERLLDALLIDRNLAMFTANTVLKQGIGLADIQGLFQLPIYTQEIINKINDHIVVLPERTAINVNTAQADVLMAGIPGLTRIKANQLVNDRTLKPMKTIQEINLALAKVGVPYRVPENTHSIDIKSNFWIARSEISLGRGLFQNTALIERSRKPFTNRVFSKVHWNQTVRRPSNV